MGENAAQTVEEVEAIRDRLDGEIRTLEERLPAPAIWMKRLVGVAVGGGVAGGAFWWGVRRLRSARSSPAAPAPVPTVIHLVPDDVADMLGRRMGQVVDEGVWRPWVATAAGLWVLFRLAEVRQLRRMNRNLLSRNGGG